MIVETIVVIYDSEHRPVSLEMIGAPFRRGSYTEAPCMVIDLKPDSPVERIGSRHADGWQCTPSRRFIVDD